MNAVMKKLINPNDVLLECIFLATEGSFIGKDAAARIVGGEKKLERFISEGKIFAEKRSSARNGKWYCRLSDVLKHPRNMRPKPKRNKKPVRVDTEG